MYRNQIEGLPNMDPVITKIIVSVKLERLNVFTHG